MNAIVVYKSKYGSTKQYADWIASKLRCKAYDAKNVKASMLEDYDTIVYGGGLYAEVIAGVGLLTKNVQKLCGKKLIVYTTGITPVSCREYYDVMVTEKNFKPEIRQMFKVFNFPGKMVLDELSPVHRTALKTLKKIMSGKENPTEMEKLLIELCDANDDYTDKSCITELIKYAEM